MINCLKKAAVCIALAGIMTGAAQAERTKKGGSGS